MIVTVVVGIERALQPHEMAEEATTARNQGIATGLIKHSSSSNMLASCLVKTVWVTRAVTPLRVRQFYGCQVLNCLSKDDREGQMFGESSHLRD
jgi:hypothetical protein